MNSTFGINITPSLSANQRRFFAEMAELGPLPSEAARIFVLLNYYQVPVISGDDGKPLNESEAA